MSSFGGFGGGSSLSHSDWSASSNRNISSGFSQAASNSTFLVINQLKTIAARSVRTSTIVLAAFNIITAFATAAGIYYDCYSSAKRNRPRGKGKVNMWTCVREEEIFPFILSLGITIQGIIFAVSQAQGLDGLFVKGCSLVSQFMWPAIFIVPYIQLIFAVEVTFRGMRSRPFPARGKWNVAICLAVLKIMLLGTGLVAFFIRASDFCFASLFWFVAKWAEGGFVLFTAIAVVMTICTITIFVKLTRYSTIETEARVAVSRMVYYFTLAIISTLLIVPFFIYLTFDELRDGEGTAGVTLSMIATVVANVSGLCNGGLHLFLRSNTISTIGPKDKLAEYERQQFKHKITRVDTLDNDDDYASHVMQPVKGARSLRRTESEESLIAYAAEARMDSPTPRGQSTFTFGQDHPNPLKGNTVFPLSPVPRPPEPAQLPPQYSRVITRRPSYSLFPSNNATNAPPTTLLPSTTYSPNPEKNFCADCECEEPMEVLKPPTQPFSRHRRDSSMASTATVQIGLRFSNVDDMPPMARTRIDMAQSHVHTLNYSGPVGPTPLAALDASFEPSPPSSPMVPFRVPSPMSPIVPSRSSTPDQDQVEWEIMKTLPPPPHAVSGVEPVAEPSRASSQPAEEPASSAADTLTLSPTVYQPNSPTKAKLPSPRGVGFNMPKRSNTTPMQPESPQQPAHSRGNSDVVDSRGQWI